MNEDDKNLNNNEIKEKIQNDSNEQLEPVIENSLSEDDKTEFDNNERPSNELIHKKEGRLHIYIRQDKYKGELKSKNWVGRLYINGKQKIISSGTKDLDEAIPVLEKWFDDVHLEAQNQNQSDTDSIKSDEFNINEDQENKVLEQQGSDAPSNQTLEQKK